MRIIGFLAFVACIIFPAISNAEDFDVSVDLAGSSSVPQLNVTIANKSSRKLVIYRNSLPWVNRPGSFVLKAFRFDSEFSEVSVGGRLSNLVGVQEILPGEVKNGVIDLCSRIRNLDYESEKGRLVFLWAYHMKSPGGADSGLYSGSFILKDPTACRA
ncbi:hypothetical protein [Lysobacter sp. CA199]|uniref:hypothetical protein n=1 Tax=Lysobacter sp. CA199 TaxID=3455608 RepID=UPI003F8D25CC